MKVSTEPTGTRQVHLTIEPDPQQIQEAMRRAARSLSRVRPVRGFRPGKAPYAMVERMLGREVVLNEALNDIADDIYREAVAEAEIEPLMQPKLDLDSQDPVILSADVPLMPLVDLGDYSSLTVEPEPAVSLTEEQIDEQLEVTRRRFAEHDPVERALGIGDQVVCDIQGESDSETVVNRDNSTVDVTDALMPPGFAEALVGMSADEKRSFSLTYPEDYDDENLAGKNVEFTVKVITVRETTLPALDDDLAKMAGDYDTLDELRGALAENLRLRLEEAARQREAEAAIAALLEQASIEYPPQALENEVESAVERQKANMQRMGFTFDAYLRMTGTTEEEFRDQIRPNAESALLRNIVLSEYANAEEVSVSEQELDGEMQRFFYQMSATYGENIDEAMRQVDGRRLTTSLFSGALVRKAIRHLTAKATGREEELEPAKADVQAEDSDAAADESLQVDSATGDQAEADQAE